MFSANTTVSHHGFAKFSPFEVIRARERWAGPGSYSSVPHCFPLNAQQEQGEQSTGCGRAAQRGAHQCNIRVFRERDPNQAMEIKNLGCSPG